MVTTKNIILQQGEDSTISVNYTVNGQPVDLTGYSARMDIVDTNNTVLAELESFNSEDNDPTTTDEIHLSSSGVISIYIRHALTVTGTTLGQNTGKYLPYDLFISNPDGIWRKILKGRILIERSHTRWQ